MKVIIEQNKSCKRKIESYSSRGLNFHISFKQMQGFNAIAECDT